MPVPPSASSLDRFFVTAILNQPDDALLCSFLDQRPDLIPAIAGRLSDTDPRTVVLFDRFFPDPADDSAEMPEPFVVGPAERRVP